MATEKEKLDEVRELHDLLAEDVERIQKGLKHLSSTVPDIEVALRRLAERVSALERRR